MGITLIIGNKAVHGASLKIAAIAPGWSVPEETVVAVSQWATSCGFAITPYLQALEPSIAHPEVSAQGARRCFLDACSDPQISVIWALRGGYGSAFLANEIANMAILKQSKHIVGCSDVTAILLALSQKYNWQCIHAPVASQIVSGGLDSASITAFKNMLGAISHRDGIDLLLPGLESIGEVRNDRISGVVTGGNLSVIVSSIGTQWQIECKGKVVLFEDVDEPMYRIDRMMTQLWQSGVLSEARAIIFGSFHKACEDAKEIRPLLYGLQQSLGCPVFHNGPFGHADRNLPFILNAEGMLAYTGGSWTMAQQLSIG
jgi:muramoyltetrapeptide carboxypeptidase